MKKKAAWGVFLSAFLGLFLLVGTSEARVVKGNTISSFNKLRVSAVTRKGTATTVPVKVKKRVVTKNGVRFIGHYTMNLARGRKVMLVFSDVTPNGVMKPVTVAQFAKSRTGTAMTHEFSVTTAVPGGPKSIVLGDIKIGTRLAVPKVNPLISVDSDDDGLSDFADKDDDNDGIPDIRDADDDGNHFDDHSEDHDSDDDGIPNIVDKDDDNDRIDDKRDFDDDGDGRRDWDGNTDSDDDSIGDSSDRDDDNDGIPDKRDLDKNGNGIEDRRERDSDRDGFPDIMDDDDDNDRSPDWRDDDNDGNGVSDGSEPDSDDDGIPNSVDY